MVLPKFKLKPSEFALSMLFGLVFVTIISTMLSQYSNIPVLATGGPFVLIIISVFIAYLFIAAKDGKIDRREIITIVFVALSLAGSIFALKSYFPQIFSVLPIDSQEFFSAFADQTKQFFSVFG